MQDGGEMRRKNDQELAREVRYMYQWEGFIVKWDSSRGSVLLGQNTAISRHVRRILDATAES